MFFSLKFSEKITQWKTLVQSGVDGYYLNQSITATGVE